MLFSVIIPIYNAEKTLQRCLDSLVPQLTGQEELILVNDGSTDRSKDICLEYSASCIHIQYLYQENAGVSSARNRGLDAASGEYITFVDSDDLVPDDYFDVLAEKLEADLLVFGEQFTQNGCVTDSYIPNTLIAACDYDDFTAAFIQSRNGSPCNKRFRRSILTESRIAFPENLRLGEDFVFCLRYIVHAKTAAAITRCAYIVDETNLQSNSRKYNADFCSQALENYRWSFDAVLSSTLEQTQKDRLAQLLDYNYYRTAFACVLELLKQKETGYLSLRPQIKEVLDAFSRNSLSCPFLGFSHKMMRCCVKRHWSLLAYFVALYRYNEKEKKALKKE